MTRGLTEIARLGVACGARTETFGGLSGMGDLIVTCTSMALPGTGGAVSWWDRASRVLRQSSRWA